MKLLLNEKIEVTDGDIKLTMFPITNSQQLELIILGNAEGITLNNEEGMKCRKNLSKWCLKNLIEKININGQDFNPPELADQADFSDAQTLKIFFHIGIVVCNAQFPSGGDVKK